MVHNDADKTNPRIVLHDNSNAMSIAKRLYSILFAQLTPNC